MNYLSVYPPNVKSFLLYENTANYSIFLLTNLEFIHHRRLRHFYNGVELRLNWYYDYGTIFLWHIDYRIRVCVLIAFKVQVTFGWFSRFHYRIIFFGFSFFSWDTQFCEMSLRSGGLNCSIKFVSNFVFDEW